MKMTVIDDGSLTIILVTDAGSNSVSFHEGEPEDMTFNRNLSGAYKIKNLILQAYEAGKNNEELIVEELDEDPEE